MINVGFRIWSPGAVLAVVSADTPRRALREARRLHPGATITGINEVGSDDLCVCGHAFGQHINGRGPCDIRQDNRYCGCTRYNSTKQD